MGYIKSEFTKETILWTIPFGIFVLIISMILAVNGIRKFLYEESASVVGLFLGILLFVGIPVLLIRIMKIRRYIVYGNKLKYYSFWCPTGKMLNFADYKGKYITTETGRGGSYEVVYLVDHQDRTRFKLMGLHYKNFDEINKAICLKKINFTPTIGQYFRLLFFERIRLVKKDREHKEEKFIKLLIVLKWIGIIGPALLALGIIIKMVLKLFG